MKKFLFSLFVVTFVSLAINAQTESDELKRVEKEISALQSEYKVESEQFKKISKKLKKKDPVLQNKAVQLNQIAVKISKALKRKKDLEQKLFVKGLSDDQTDLLKVLVKQNLEIIELLKFLTQKANY